MVAKSGVNDSGPQKKVFIPTFLVTDTLSISTSKNGIEPNEKFWQKSLFVVVPIAMTVLLHFVIAKVFGAPFSEVFEGVFTAGTHGGHIGCELKHDFDEFRKIIG